MKSKLVIAGIMVVGCAGILVAAPWKKKDESGKEKNKKYQVISMQDGQLVEYDTIIPMNSNYTVDQFLSDKNIENDDVQIIKIPSAGEMEMEFFQEDGDDNKKIEKKVIVKTEIRTDDDSKSDHKNGQEENVQITCTVDENGKMIAKKIVNGKEVEMTEDEINKMMKMHLHHDSKDGEKGKVMIKIDVDDENMDELHEDIMEKVLEHLKDLDFDINIGEHLNIDSLINVFHENIDVDVNGEDIKVVMKKLNPDAQDGEHNHLIIIKDGEKVEWNSKNGAKVEMITDGGSQDDFTIVIVTENIDEKEPRKTIKTSKEDLKVFPNPNNGKFTVQMNLDQKSKVKIEVTDLQGKTILAKDLGKVSGKINEDLNLTEKGAGIYIINVYTGKNKSTQKVIVR